MQLDRDQFSSDRDSCLSRSRDWFRDYSYRCLICYLYPWLLSTALESDSFSNSIQSMAFCSSMKTSIWDMFLLEFLARKNQDNSESFNPFQTVWVTMFSRVLSSSDAMVSTSKAYSISLSLCVASTSTSPPVLCRLDSPIFCLTLYLRDFSPSILILGFWDSRMGRLMNLGDLCVSSLQVEEEQNKLYWLSLFLLLSFWMLHGIGGETVADLLVMILQSSDGAISNPSSIRQLGNFIIMTELKEFQVQTKFREVAEEAISPIVNRLEVQVNEVLKQVRESDQLNKQKEKIILSFKQIMERLQDSRRQVQDLSVSNVQLKSSMQSDKIGYQATKLDLQLQVDNLSRELAANNRKLGHLIKKYEVTCGKLEDFREEVSNSTISVHQKVTEGLEGCLQQVFAVMINNERIVVKQSQLELVVNSWKETSLQNHQHLQLYLKDREAYTGRIAKLQQRLEGMPGGEEFETYKKHNSIQLNAAVGRLTRLVDSALPPKIREHLPSLNEFSSKLQAIKQEQQHSRERVEESFNQLTTQLKGEMQFQELRTVQFIKSQFETVVRDKQREIYNAVVDLVPQHEKQAFEGLKRQIPLIEVIRADIMARSLQIADTADRLNQTINTLSNKVTKIRTDLQLRSGAIEAEVKSLHKQKQRVDSNFSAVGRVISFLTETTGILIASELQSEALRETRQQEQIFATVNDGIVFETKLGLSPSLLEYRKKVVQKYDLLKATMFSFVRFVDSLFKEDCLNIDTLKPSEVFRLLNVECLPPITSCRPISISKKLIIRNSGTPEPFGSFQQRQAIEGHQAPKASLSVEHIQLFQIPIKNKPRITATRYEDFMCKTSRIRSRNLTRQSHM